MTPEITLNIQGGLLRVLLPDDIHPAYVKGLNDREVNRYLDGVKRNIQTTQSVFDFVQVNRYSDSSVLWGIWEDGRHLHCGTVRLHGTDPYHKAAHCPSSNGLGHFSI